MKNIAITGGGTGGHLSIVRAVKEELNLRGMKPLFFGCDFGQDREWFEDDEGFCQKYFFDITSVVDKNFKGKLTSMSKILKSSVTVRKIFKEYDIEAVLSVGGYAAAPASIAAIFTGKEFYIHEQNAVMGRLNAIFAKRAKTVFSPYLESSPVKDYPVSDSFFQSARLRSELKTIIFLGGSQGATAINDFAKCVAKGLDQKGIKIIHQSGKRDFEALKKFYKQEGIDADLFDFHKNLHKKISEADFAICRAGAGTLWELVANQLPAMYIPYPYASNDHQFYNAKYLLDKRVSFLVRQNELSSNKLSMIFGSDLADMSEGLKGIISPEGAAKIVDFMNT